MSAMVTTDPSGVRSRVTDTCGGGGGAGAAGTVLAIWLAAGRVRAAGVAGARVAAEEPAALVRPDGPAGCAGADGELHAVVAPRPASARAVQNLRIINSRMPRVGTIRSRCQAIRLPRQAAPSGSPAGAGSRHRGPNWPSQPPWPAPPGCWRPERPPAPSSPA